MARGRQGVGDAQGAGAAAAHAGRSPGRIRALWRGAGGSATGARVSAAAPRRDPGAGLPRGFPGMVQGPGESGRAHRWRARGRPAAGGGEPGAEGRRGGALGGAARPAGAGGFQARAHPGGVQLSGLCGGSADREGGGGEVAAGQGVAGAGGPLLLRPAVHPQPRRRGQAGAGGVHESAVAAGGGGGVAGGGVADGVSTPQRPTGRTSQRRSIPDFYPGGCWLPWPGKCIPRRLSELGLSPAPT